MTKREDSKKLENFNSDEILCELRERECMSKAERRHKKPGPLSSYDTKALVETLKNSQKLIYGMDDRQDLFLVNDPEVKRNANSVVALIDAGNISDNGNGTSTISTTTFAAANSLCSTERFGQQPTAPFCSGFLVAPDIIATAGHCVEQNSLPRVRYVFGFRMINETKARVVVSNEDIYRGVGIISRKEESTGSDYAIVRLDRPAVGHPVVSIRRSGKVGDNQKVYVIGHPSRLPLKYASRGERS